MCSQDIFLNPAYISEVTELDTLRQLPLQSFIEQICGNIRKMSNTYDKNSVQDFKESVKQKYGMKVGAKWNEQKDTFFIEFYLPEIIHIYSGQTHPIFDYPLEI